MVHSRYMQGGGGLDRKGGSSAPLNAYILIAMMEAGYNSTVSILLVEVYFLWLELLSHVSVLVMYNAVKS